MVQFTLPVSGGTCYSCVCLRFSLIIRLCLQPPLPDALASLDPATLVRLEEDLCKLIGRLEADEASANVPLAQL